MLARHWLSSLLPTAPGDASRAAPPASGGVNSAVGLCPFLEEKGTGLQVLSSWAVWEGEAPAVHPAAERAESSQMSSHPSLPLQLPFAHTIMMICFADAFPGTNTHFQWVQRQKEFLSVKEQMVHFIL